MINPITVTQRASFEACYIMEASKDIGLQFHGHNYKVEVTVSGNQRMTDLGFIIEFSELRRLLVSVLPDHKFLAWPDKLSDMLADIMSPYPDSFKYIDYPPTAENLIAHIVDELQHILNKYHPGVIIVNAKLRENNDSFAEWTKAPESL